MPVPGAEREAPAAQHDKETWEAADWVVIWRPKLKEGVEDLRAISRSSTPFLLSLVGSGCARQVYTSSQENERIYRY